MQVVLCIDVTSIEISQTYYDVESLARANLGGFFTSCVGSSGKVGVVAQTQLSVWRGGNHRI